jgi:uncharacterized protein YegP (UPF0339 family)
MYFRIYQDVAKEWRWTLYGSNHRKVADSAEGYWNKSDCLAGIQLVKGASSQTPIYE